MKKTSDANRKAGIFLASMPVVQANLNQKMSNGDRTYDSGKRMSETRSKQVIAIFRSLSQSK